jgi:hypothetical protein
MLWEAAFSRGVQLLRNCRWYRNNDFYFPASVPPYRKIMLYRKKLKSKWM